MDVVIQDLSRIRKAVSHRMYHKQEEVSIVIVTNQSLDSGTTRLPHEIEDGNQIQFEKYVDFYKSIIDQDRCSIVICNLQHEIIYMNPAAIKNYAKRGGEKLIGQSIMDCHHAESCDKMRQVVEWFTLSPDHNMVYTFYNEKQNKDVYMVALRSEGKLIGYYEKHEFRNRETMKQYDLW